jgi:hypothetical protein
MLTFRMKALFFDRKAVLDAVGRASAKALTKIGGTIRKTAQRSMRYRKKPSPPGAPPSAHKDNPRGPLLREKLWFAYEPARASVIIGPVGFTRKAGAAAVPQVHEFGGKITRWVRQKKAKAGRKATPAQTAAFLRKVKSGQIRTKQQPKVRQTVTLPKRPFMGPALMKHRATLSRAWQNTFRPAA